MLCKSFSHFVNKKHWHISDILTFFSATLTDDVLNFEQPDPDALSPETARQRITVHHRAIVLTLDPIGQEIVVLLLNK